MWKRHVDIVGSIPKSRRISAQLQRRHKYPGLRTVKGEPLRGKEPEAFPA